MSTSSSITVYTAKKIITMNDSHPSTTAVAVRGDKILAVGSMDDLKSVLGTNPYVVDETFKDKVILPGFINNHLHPFLGGVLLPMEFIVPEDWDLPGRAIKAVRGREQFLSRLKEVEASPLTTLTAFPPCMLY
jgi:predicted amidohydrolase YtcJ